MGTLKSKFGKRLKYLRESRHLSQAELAEKISLSPESISNIERGVHAPKFETIERLAEALAIPVKSLFDFG